MASIRISGNGFITKGPPWAHRFNGLKLGRLGFLPGSVPPQLRRFLFQKGGVPAQCARETTGLSGATRVIAMNACVSRVAGGRGGGGSGAPA